MLINGRQKQYKKDVELNAEVVMIRIRSLSLFSKRQLSSYLHITVDIYAVPEKIL